jgi:hypothetical protein
MPSGKAERKEILPHSRKEIYRVSRIINAPADKKLIACPAIPKRKKIVGFRNFLC